MKDRLFQRWAEDGLVWLPERGMGYYPVTEAPYDADYWQKYVVYAETPMGSRLNEVRVEVVDRLAGRDAVVLDVGIGCGSFVEARPGITYGHDINPVGVRWLKARGLYLDPRDVEVDAMTFWDVLEHIHDPGPVLANIRQWAFVSLPIVPGDGPPPLDWRHFRRDEHCWYWTRAGFLDWMAEHGFECVEHGTPESLAGREDIETFAFRRHV